MSLNTDDTIDPHWHLKQVPQRTKRLVNAHKSMTGLSQSMALADLVQVDYELRYGIAVRPLHAASPLPPRRQPRRGRAEVRRSEND